MCFRRISLAALVASALAVPSFAQAPDELDRQLARAVEMQQAGDYLGAIETYRIVLQSAPNRADVHSNLGAAYIRLGQFEQGMTEYREAIRLDPATPVYRFNLALALYKSGRHEEAIPEFAKVLEAEPGNKAAALLLGDSQLQLGKYADVIATLAPRDPDFQADLGYAYVLGMAYLRAGQQDKGQVLIDRIFRAGESAEGHLLMGLAHMNRLEYKEAVPDLAKAVELKPDLPSARTLYGRALLGSGDQDAANAQFAKALELNPNDFEANLQLGNIRKREQRLDDALTYLDRASAIRPNELAVRHALAGVYLAKGNDDKARQLLEGIVKDNPDFVDAHVLLATAYYRLKRKEDGDRERQIVVKLNAENQAKQPQPSSGPPAPAAPAPPPDNGAAAAPSPGGTR